MDRRVGNQARPEAAGIGELPRRDYTGDDVVTSLDAARARDAGPDARQLPEPLLAIAPPMYQADGAGRLTLTNPAFDRLFAANDGDTDANGTPFELTGIFARLRGGESEITLRKTVRIGGRERHYRSNHFRTLDDDGRVVYSGLFTDVTVEIEAVVRSAQAEARFRDLIRSTSDWVWETDAEINLTYVSNRITEALGMPPAALKGKNLFSFGRFESEPGAARPPDLQRTMSPFRRRIFLMPDRDGKVRRIALSGVPVFDEATGRFTGYRGTGSDVTRRHDAEQRAHKSQHQLEASLTALRERNLQLDRALGNARSAAVAKTEFLGKMSHELRTPLNAIIGFAEMSMGQVFGPLSGRYLGYFKDIRGAAHHLLEIINDILDAVNVEANKVSVTAQPVRVATVIGEAKSIIAGRAEQRGIDIGAIVETGGWVVMADPGRVRQIFVNLLNNAVKFTEAGGSIGIDTTLADDDLLDITVWDTGIGIPGDHLAKIFDSFHQVGSDVMSQPREGTGLGLSISQQLAGLMAGEIFVDSAPGRGSRFTVRLPLARNISEAEG